MQWKLSLTLLTTLCDLTLVFINIHSVSTTALLGLVSAAVHVTVRFLGGNFLRSIVSTVAFLRELNPGIPVVLFKTSPLAIFNCVVVAVVCPVGKTSQTSFIVHKTLAMD